MDTDGSSKISRRDFLRFAGAAGISLSVGSLVEACAPVAPVTKSTPSSVVIAYNDEIATLDPHKPNRNLTQLSPHKCIWDHFIAQDHDLKYHPHVLTKWDWANADKTALDVQVQEGIKFHNGDPLTAEDVAFSLERLKTKGFAYAGVFGVIDKAEVTGTNSLRLGLSHYDPSIRVWLGFINALVIPKKYFTQVGEDAFFKNPIGSGPYKFKEFVAGSHLTLEAFDGYWKGAPPIKTVTFKIVTDSTARAAQIEAGSADFTLEVPIADFDRLSKVKGLTGKRQPVTDVGLLFLAPYFEPFKDENVRVALDYALDKEKLVKDVLLGFGVALSTTEAPGYAAYSKEYKFPYDPQKASDLLAQSGYSKNKPLKLSVMATNGFKARDYELIEACVAMWKTVGVEADIQTITTPQFFDYRVGAKLAPLSLYYWSNPTGDPINSIGLSQRPSSSFSVWKGNVDYTGAKADLDARLGPIFSEKDETKRIAAAQSAATYIVEHGFVIPLYQVVSPIVMKDNLQYEPYPQGWIIPSEMRWAA
ncbi:MAG: ABC transporter substrate-binding protein [Chloroflexi bacterium]|nr:ABC transporter substrate-binding protein [Chloroflexota bacterium]